MNRMGATGVMMLIVVAGWSVFSQAQVRPRPTGTPSWASPEATPTPTPLPEQSQARRVGREMAAVDRALWTVFDARKDDGAEATLSAVEDQLGRSHERVKEAVRGFEVMACEPYGDDGARRLSVADPELLEWFLSGYQPALDRYRSVREEIRGDEELEALLAAVSSRQMSFQDRICDELLSEASRTEPKQAPHRRSAGDSSATY